MSNMFKVDVAADLREVASNHALTPEQADAFVKANEPTISLVYATWSKMLTTIPSLKPVIEAARRSNGTINFFTLFDGCISTSKTAIRYLHETGSLPAPYADVNVKRFLTVLRYPKRVPLLLADWLVTEAKEKFFRSMDLNNKWVDNPDAIRPEYCRDYPIIRQYKELIHSWLDEILPPMEWFGGQPDPFTFSPGAVADACTNPFCKWFRAEHSMHRHSKLLPIPVIDPVVHRNSVEESFSTVATLSWTGSFPYRNMKCVAVKADQPKMGNGHARTIETGLPRFYVPLTSNEGKSDRVLSDAYYIKPITVPKQIDAVRVVCPEKAYNARYQNYLSKRLRKWWKKLPNSPFCQDIQNWNKACAKVGSRHDCFATIDSTAASDTVHRDLISEIDDPRLDFLMEALPKAVVWGKTTRWLGMFGTMGSPLTFDVEMIIFYILVRLGMTIARLGMEEDEIPNKADDLICAIYIVGDDIVCPAWCAETVLDVLRACHMIPNDNKTYISGHYRESCGGEYVDGIDVSGTYWPRGLSLDDTENTRWDGWKECYSSPTISLVSHHNSLLMEGYDDAAAEILDYIRTQCDVGYGLDATAEWNDTLIGISMNAFEDQAGKRRFSPYFKEEYGSNESYLLLSPVTTWEPTEPKKTCWCNNMPSEALEMLEDEWKYYSHDVYIEDDYGAAYSLPREPHVRMRPRTKLMLSRHS